jgi:hypothetical protein
MRFERMTHSLEGCCSIQLSYRTSDFADAKVLLLFKFQKEYPIYFVLFSTIADLAGK